jgi:alkyldihydroxyacetonephosphate synthase
VLTILRRPLRLASVNVRRHKHWGWGFADQQPSLADVRAGAAALATHLGVAFDGEVEQPVALEALELAPPRVVAPASLRSFCADDARARAGHALGKSYSDIVRGFRGRFEYPPDFVARPREEVDLERVLEWCAAERVAAIPFGGGTSVVGGVTPDVGPSYNGAVSIDLRALDRVLEVDPVSRAARIQAGATGPGLESQLAEQGLTLRHFPQSFEYSTLGGWIATRAAGHFATIWTHIEDLVESVRAIAPSGEWSSRRLPGSGAGPSPDRMLAGSEGTLGVIVDAWMRVQPPPSHRRSAGVRFPSFFAGAECVRALSQSGLHPSNCRLLDPGEARLTMAGDGSHALLVLGFESADHPVDDAMARALAICAEHGGVAEQRRGDVGGRGAASGGGAGRGGDAGAAAGRVAGTGAGGGGERDAVGAWRDAFLGAPYLRDMLVAMGILSETFETAITWERFPGLHAQVTAAAEEAVREVCGGEGRIFCRFTHVYPDGPAPYFTVIAPARRGAEVEQWGAIKRAVSAALIAEGATITHHHAVGRDHRPWYDMQRPAPFAAALSGAKAALDPQGIMNPGVLIDPPTTRPGAGAGAVAFDRSTADPDAGAGPDSAAAIARPGGDRT